MTIQVERAHGLEALGIVRSGRVHWNLGTAALYEEALRRSEGNLAAEGPLVCKTGLHTGRSPNDKFVVKEAASEKHVHWGTVNRPIDEAKFDQLHKDMMAHLQGKELYVLDAWAGTDPAFRLPIRVVNEFAWHNLFARNMFLPENDPQKRTSHRPEFTVIDAPHFKSDPARHGTRSDCFIFVHFGRKLVLIGGTHYAGEIKKSIFTILNYTLPLQGVLSMHCSANIGAAGDTALFFGLSGTGKTTLSSDPERRLIGDDEHGWSDTGVFNFEGGCYAKVIKLSQEAEPQIYATTRRFGTILENVVIDPDTRALNLDDASMTENTRGSYPIDFIDNAEMSGRGGHPQNVVMLTADAYGVLPPDRATLTRCGDVSLPVGIYGARCRYRKGRDRTEGDIQHMLWCPVPSAQSERLCPHARREDRQARCTRVAGEHGLDRWAVRCGLAHEDRLHTRDDHGCVDRKARQRAGTASIRSSISRCPRHAPACRTRCSIREARGPMRRSTTSRRRSSRRCSSTTSSPSRRTWRPR